MSRHFKMIPSSEQIAINIINKINSADTILVVCSKPIDHDSLGTALACKIWLDQLGKKVTVINCFRLTEDMKIFPNVEQISFEQGNPNLNNYDLVITLDSRLWSQLFKNIDIVYEYGLDKIVNIDHHSPADIVESIPETALRVTLSSTAEVLYTYLLAGNIKITPIMATYLYIALVGDTGNFKWAIGAETMKFAETLKNSGADIELIKSIFEPTEKEFKYYEWAHKNIQHYPDLEVELFQHSPEMDSEIEHILQTEYWEDFNKHFVLSFFDEADLKYNYLITLKQDEDELRLSWRTRNEVPNTIEVVQAAINAGFAAGGHRNAGGGSIKINANENINIIKDRLFAQIKLEQEKN